MNRARSLTVALVLATLAATPCLTSPTAAAAASSSSVVLYGVGVGRQALQRTASVSASGQLSVDFHGDAAAGCAALGVCGYSGWVSWQPPPHSTLMLFGARSHGRTTWTASLQFGGLLPAGYAATSTAVQLAGAPGACLDSNPGAGSVALALRGGSLSFDLARAQGTLLDNRCAGPRDAQILGLLPAPRVSLAALARGSVTESLARSVPFSAHGFAGTVNSTIVLRVGRVGRTTRLSSGSLPPGSRLYRKLTLTYRARLSGSVIERFRGASQPAICTPLQSCGASGTSMLAPIAGARRAQLVLYAPMSVPSARLLAVAGLARGVPAPAAGTGGSFWASGGTVTTRVTQPSAGCRDAALLGGGGLILAATRRKLVASYLAPGLSAVGSTGTVCPGPSVGTAALAGGLLPVAALRRRTFTLRLGTGVPFVDYGYSVAVASQLTLVLTRISARLGQEPLPPGFLP
ncbi:MAG: hypothetical protein ACYC0H_15070 [Solirubrobacteraceae bacterium]